MRLPTNQIFICVAKTILTRVAKTLTRVAKTTASRILVNQLVRQILVNQLVRLRVFFKKETFW